MELRLCRPQASLLQFPCSSTTQLPHTTTTTTPPFSLRRLVTILRSNYTHHSIRLPRNNNPAVVVHFDQNDRNCNTGVPDTQIDGDRPPFDLDLAVVLAGFAFEAYNTPAKSVGVQEKDAGDCETTYLALHFLREVYDGQIIVKLKKGSHFPGLDFWGTSDPYVVIRCGDCEAQSKVVWATRDPVWNEELKLNVKDAESQFLQIAAWDANVITAHRRMGNTGLSLKDLSDGSKHEVEVQLGGMGGGGAIQLEVQYKSFDSEEKSWWILPSFTDLLHMGGMDGVYKKVFGEDGIGAGDFVRSTLGSLPFLLEEDNKSNNNTSELNIVKDKDTQPFNWFGFGQQSNSQSKENENEQDDYVRSVVQAVGNTLTSLGVDIGTFDTSSFQADGEAINKLGSEFQSKAEANYVESGLAVPSEQSITSPDSQNVQQGAMPEQLQRASKSLLQNTENFLGMWATVARAFPGNAEDEESSTLEIHQGDDEESGVEENEAKRQMFQTAESAVEAWAMLATSLGGQSFVKSEFEKICFLENRRTDTEVAIWRDAKRRRLVFAFRGTEQTKWKDLSTDMNVIPVGFNPERIGGNFKEDVMVHGGFLNAYDSVRRRLMTLLQASIGVSDTDDDPSKSWQIYSTGHSLGGALATLFALELSSCKLAKKGHIQVTMYNFGSPRVGNKRFAESYNQAIKDSWRVVNHRDIIPTVPRLMGYCHVAQPIYLSTGALTDAIVERDLLEDGYHGDVIGEVTADFVFENVVSLQGEASILIVRWFQWVTTNKYWVPLAAYPAIGYRTRADFLIKGVKMKGERKMLERLLQTEIAMLRAIRDGSALMQHMEDFYYIALLERVEQKMARRLK